MCKYAKVKEYISLAFFYFYFLMNIINTQNKYKKNQSLLTGFNR